MAWLRGRWLRRVGIVVVGAIVALTAVLWVVQDRLVFVPSDDRYPVDADSVGIVDVPYRSSDGIDLHGWLVPSRQPAPTCGTTPVAIVFHGQGGNKTWGYPLAEALAAHGTTVFLAEYRGYGGTAGQPSEDGFALDAQAALDTVRTLDGVDRTKVVYVGVSLGTGVAVRLATAEAPAGQILLAPYTSLADIAWTRLPGLPYRWLLRNQFDSEARMSLVDAPTLVVIGTADETVPNEESRRVYATATRPDSLVELEGRSHAEVEIHAGDEAIVAMSGAISRWTGCPRP